MIDMATGIAIAAFIITSGGIIIAAILGKRSYQSSSSNSGNGNGLISERLCTARRLQCETRFDNIDKSLADIKRHMGIDEND